MSTQADNSFEDFAYGTAGGGEDFANGLNGGSGSFFVNFKSGYVEYGGAGGFGGGGGGGGGGGYTGGDPGAGGTSFVASNAVDPVVVAGVETGNGAVTIDYPACFAEGTRITTPSGPLNVETLRPGDMVLSARRGLPVEVRWVGHRHIDCARHPDPAKVLPVRIRAHAFGLGLPVRDLFLSPDHAVFAEGALIPVRVLVNGHSVAHHLIAKVTYWHIEVDEHDVLLAEGMPVESYLDTGGRAGFVGGPVAPLAPDVATRVWEAEGCAPLRVMGTEVDAVRARLARAVRQGRRAGARTRRAYGRAAGIYSPGWLRLGHW